MTKFRAELDKIKTLSGADLLDHIWTYYKFQICATLFIAVLVFSFAYTTVINPPKKPVVTLAWFYGFEHVSAQSNNGVIFLDTLSDELTLLLADGDEKYFAEVMNFINTGNAQYDMASQNRFVAMATSSEIDLLVGSRAQIENFASLGLLQSIENFLPADCGDNAEFFYIEQGLRYGAAINNSALLVTNKMYVYEPLYIAVAANTRRAGTVMQTLAEFMTEAEVDDDAGL